MRRTAGSLAVLMLAGAAPGIAQTIGEFRLLGMAASARRPHPAEEPHDFPSLGARTIGGVSGSLSFVHGALSLGPEAMVLRGSDRRMYGLGGVARLGLAEGYLRPFILVGAGVYSWDRKTVLPFDPSAGAVWIGDLTYLTGNAGGGVVMGVRNVALVLEVRGHKSLGKKEDFGSRNMLSISAGGRFSW